MIDSIRGRILSTEPELLMQAGPVVLRMEISGRTRVALPQAGGEATVFTELLFREDRLELIGFSRPEERSLYRLLTGISGVGKRVALAVLSELGVEELARVVALGDEKRLTKVSGVGGKTASRLILELAGKLDAFLPPGGTLADQATPPEDPLLEEALLALTALGMNRQAALRALERKTGEARSVEELIREALAAGEG